MADLTRRGFLKVFGVGLTLAAKELSDPRNIAAAVGKSIYDEMAYEAFLNAVEHNLMPGFEAASQFIPSYHDNSIDPVEAPAKWLAQPLGIMLGLSARESTCDPEAKSKTTNAFGHMQILKSTFLKLMAISDKARCVEALGACGDKEALQIYQEVMPFIYLDKNNQAKLKENEYKAWCQTNNVNWNNKAKQPKVALTERIYKLRKTAVATVLFAENLEREENQWDKKKRYANKITREALVLLRHNFGIDDARTLLLASPEKRAIDIRTSDGRQPFYEHLLDINGFSERTLVKQIVSRMESESALIKSMRKFYIQWKDRPEIFAKAKVSPEKPQQTACQKCERTGAGRMNVKGPSPS